MKLGELRETIISTVLYPLAVADINDAEKGAYRKKQIDTWINLGIVDINGEFSLNQKALIIKNDGINLMYNTPDDWEFIVGAYDIKGQPIAVNKEDEIESIMTPSAKMLAIPYYWEGQNVHIVYQATIPFMVNDDDDFPLPAQYLSPLIYYVGSFAYELTDPEANGEHNTFDVKYEKALLKIRRNSMNNYSDIMNNKKWQKGFI